jgi:hypothetical protein
MAARSQGGAPSAARQENDPLQFPVSYARGLVPVGLVNPSPNYLAGALRGHPSDGVGNHWWHRLAAADLHACQLPDPVASLRRPADW